MTVPANGLISKQYAAARFAEINPYRAEPRASKDVPYGFPAKFENLSPGAAAPTSATRPGRLQWDDDKDEDPGSARQADDPFDRWNRRKEGKSDKGDKGGKGASAPTATPGTAPEREPGEGKKDDEFDGGSTTHLSVIDADSNMVSLTQTLGNFFGSKTMVNGILLNNGRVNFSTASPANLIGPNKRPRSSITPTLVFRDGRPLMSLGSPGAGRIIATVALVMVNIIDFGMDVEAANEAPRFFAQKFDEHLYIESRVAPAIVEELKRQGHDVRVLGDMDLYFGGVQIAAFKEDGTGFVGSADKRRGGTASVLDAKALETVPGD
jgi:gamma-glutamyltranspeptidase